MKKSPQPNKLDELSTSIIACAFVSEDATREDLRAASDSLYLDMLQYLAEHPGASYREVYRHFVDEELHQCLRKRARQRCFLHTILTAFLIIFTVIAALKACTHPV